MAEGKRRMPVGRSALKSTRPGKTVETGRRRRDFLHAIERARKFSPEERFEMALELIDSMMELREAARDAQKDG